MKDFQVVKDQDGQDLKVINTIYIFFYFWSTDDSPLVLNNLWENRVLEKCIILVAEIGPLLIFALPSDVTLFPLKFQDVIISNYLNVK